MANTSILAAFERMWQHVVYALSNIQTQLDNKKSSRTSRLTVGTSTSGWTAADCDYLCDGMADDVEINAAIAALPVDGGEIIILDGTYNLSDAIVLGGTHITLQGNNGATRFVRAFSGSDTAMGVIVVSGSYCTVQGLSIDGVKNTYTGYYHSGIYVSGGHNNFIENETMNNETSGIYISTTSASYNMIRGNKSRNNNGHGIYNNSTNTCNTFSDNTCEGNGTIGIYVGNNGKNTVTGNICITNGTHGIGLYTSDSGVSGNVCNGNTRSGLYSSNGKYNGISGNTFNSNGEYGIQFGANTLGNSLAGNTFENNTSGDTNDAGSNTWSTSHNHAASEITSGTLSSDRLPTVPISKGGTGATTAVEALDNLGALNLNRISDNDHLIPEGADLNDYITPGVYRASTAAIAASLVNGTPYTSAGFRLIVSANSHASTGVIQMAFFNATSNYVYYRIQNNSGTWSQWANLMKNVLSPQEYGTSLPTAGTKGRIFFKKA